MSRELPIVFDTESVKAILDRGKTQTRRVMKPFPDVQCVKLHQHGDEWLECRSEHSTPCYRDDVGMRHRSPYRKDDLLWVKETWLELDPAHVFLGERYYYKADCTTASEQLREEYGYRWASPASMPKKAARLWLRVTDVRAERLQDIAEDDARMEGVSGLWNYQPPEYYEDVSMRYLDYYTAAFAGRWDRLNAKRGYPWDDNPWVWVYEFRLERVVK